MIRAACFTNVDKYKGRSWPTRFVAVPQIDDMVGEPNGMLLRVVRVTHMQDQEGMPYIKVELHLPDGMRVSDHL
jgi:hypothetical protein